VVLQPNALHDHSLHIHCCSKLSLSDPFCVSYSTMLHKLKLCKNEWLGSLPMMDPWKQDLSGSNGKKLLEGHKTLLNDRFSTLKSCKCLTYNSCHRQSSFATGLSILCNLRFVVNYMNTISIMYAVICFI
jgi:hypothetical protein